MPLSQAAGLGCSKVVSGWERCACVGVRLKCCEYHFDQNDCQGAQPMLWLDVAALGVGVRDTVHVLTAQLHLCAWQCQHRRVDRECAGCARFVCVRVPQCMCALLLGAAPKQAYAPPVKPLRVCAQGLCSPASIERVWYVSHRWQDLGSASRMLNTNRPWLIHARLFATCWPWLCPPSYRQAVCIVLLCGKQRQVLLDSR